MKTSGLVIAFLIILVLSMLCPAIVSANERVVVRVFLSDAEWAEEPAAVEDPDKLIEVLNSHIASVRNDLEPLMPPTTGINPEDADYGVDQIEILDVGQERYDLSCQYQRPNGANACKYSVQKSELYPGALLAQRLIEGTIYHPLKGAYGPPVEISAYREIPETSALIATITANANSRIKTDAEYVLMKMYSLEGVSVDCYTKIYLTMKAIDGGSEKVLLTSEDRASYNQFVETLARNIELGEKTFLAMAYQLETETAMTQLEQETLKYDLTSSGNKAEQSCSR